MTDNPATRGPTIALALGAGGAKGLAHIGVIEELTARGCHVTAIAGSSMGALIGGIHAMGKLDVYRDWVVSLAKLDVLRLVDWTLSGGLIKGDRIIDTMRELIGDTLIEKLPIAYTAVATDIDRGREMWLTRGPLFDAIRASIAIPTIFRPHLVDGHRCVDGALLNPVPVTPLIRERADYVIAVSLDGAASRPPTAVAAPATEPAVVAGYRQRIGAFVNRVLAHRDMAAAREPGALELLAQSIELMQANLARLRLAAYEPDLLIQLPRNIASAYEFYRARDLIELGRAAAHQALATWPPTAQDADA
ncbi:MAG: serine protease [Rhodanobacter sp.]|nr:MAG: serine protease [Rhodanobacter sp.]TAM14249.1 MAG: serine protease [Rhodanobacter sp.]TAM34825.1 MAG: serine protease [Rhodanobacter sp.]